VARRRNGQCTLCGCWVDFGTKGVRCTSCKAPTVRAARAAIRADRKANADERVIAETPLDPAKRGAA